MIQYSTLLLFSIKPTKLAFKNRIFSLLTSYTFTHLHQALTFPLVQMLLVVFTAVSDPAEFLA